MLSKEKTMMHTAATAIIFMAFLMMPGMCSAQTDAWTWMSGSDQIDSAGVYGTRGVAAAANVPGARYDSCSWTDSSGDLWLFGGAQMFGGSANWPPDLLNDLWHYDSGTGQWTWMSGANVPNQLGVYGTRGVADAANVPGARYGAVCWIDEDDNLWLFGGEGYDRAEWRDVWDEDGWVKGWLNDMWRYDTATNQWSWVAGDDMMDDYNEKGYYDDPGYPQPYVFPGAREGAISWTDSFGFMWMFGGYGWQDISYFEKGDKEYCFEGEIEIDPDTGEVKDPRQDCPDPGALNDLWAYNKATNEWAWVSGSDDKDQQGSYGTKGVATFANVPGARWGSIPWIDKDNNLWLFGGIGKDINVPEGFVRRMSDLWRYDPVAKMWTWVSGLNVGDQIGVYDESIGDLRPGCREESSSWIDNAGNLWLVGGFGLASTYSPIGGLLNDQWFFNTAAKEWFWVSGSDEISNPNDTVIAGVYGTKGVPDENNVTGARESAVPWIDSLGNVWLFGGFGFDGYGGYGSLNDLWRFGSRACVDNADCNDSLYCTGVETCVAGVCVDGTAPCSGGTPFCDETLDICRECGADSNCDDGLYCSGIETCVAGVCVDGTNPCIGGPNPVCDEAANVCVAIECVNDIDCNDDLYCTGVETCVSNVCVDGTNPCSGLTPVCDEIGDVCVAGCLDDSDCDDAYFCQNEVCVPKCRLLIKYKTLSAAKLLYKDKKITFKIITGSFGAVDMGPDIQILATKPNTKKSTVKVKAIVPAGIGPQTIPVWVGDCYGEIVILP